MRTHLSTLSASVWLGTKIGLALLILSVCAQRTVAQNTFPNPGPGNVGIGTTSPGDLLEINKSQNAGTTLTIDNANTSSSNAAYSGFWFKQNGSARFFFGSINDNNTTQTGGAGATQVWNFANGPMLFATNNTERLRIGASGNIGIGTTSPANPLDIATNQNAVVNLIGVNNSSSGSSAQAALNFYEGSTSKAKFGVNNSGASGYVGGANAFQMWNFQNAPIVFGTNSAERARIDSAGNVGIGTSSPVATLEVKKSGANFQLFNSTSSGNADLFVTANNASAVTKYFISRVAPDDATNGTYYLIPNSTSTSSAVLTVQSGGTVGIGTTTPNSSYKLDVNGHTNVTGNLNVTGNIAAKYQDVAEWVPSSEQLPAGTVVVLDATKSNQVISSTEAYDTRVAGVVSEKPGIALGESGSNKVLVATTGRVLVQVDASKSPIHIGDLLVTSDIPGVAMKSEPIKVGGRLMHMPGTLIGKALEPLEKGSGKILVLLSLQ